MDNLEDELNKNHNCCIQIFNQCNNKKSNKHKPKFTNSIEMTNISSSEKDHKSTKSLPLPQTSYQYNKTHDFITSSRRNVNL